MLHRRTSSSPQLKILLEQRKLLSLYRMAIMILRKTVPTFAKRERTYLRQTS